LTLFQESFGIECGRLANLPEEILATAARRASDMQDETESRIKKKRSEHLQNLEYPSLRNLQAIGGPASNTALHKGQWNRGTCGFGRTKNYLGITAYMD
jgi:DNA mismatch repair protein MSH3